MTMQSHWKELAELHVSLTQAAVCTINPNSWYNIISRTLMSFSQNDDTKCHVSAEVCWHCHQMMALSAVTTMTVLAKDKRDEHTDLEDIYLQPLLQPGILKHMVDLLQHQCQYLRYQSQKTLTSLCSLTVLTESLAQTITEQCVQAALHRTTDDTLCLEPLQLLCCLLSARSGCVHRYHVSDVLLPSLPALYQHCCHFLWNRSTDLSSRAESATDQTVTSGNANVVRASQTQTVSTSTTKRTHHGNTDDPPCKQVRTGHMQGESQSAPFSMLGNECVQEMANKFGCEGQGEGNKDSVLSSAVHSSSEEFEHISDEKNVCEAVDTKQKSSNQNCSVVHHVGLASKLDRLVQGEQQTCTLYSELDSDVSNPSVYSSHSSHPTVMLHYAFLCLIQKFAKFCNSLEPGEKVMRMEVLKNSVLTQLVSDHAALFSNYCARQTNDYLLVARKFLDVVDTTMDYIWLRTSKNTNCVYQQIAAHFVHSMLAVNCCWSIPCQSTLIGGQPEQTKERGGNLHVIDSMCASENKSGDELLERKQNTDCSPVLVVLLAAVFKSCATVFRSESGESEEVKACTALLHSMHGHLHQMLDAGSSGEKQTGGSSTCMTWLAQVCGDQDDRWIEALLCALDIFLCLQSLTTDSDDVTLLMTLLDPHLLFIQLLELTHYNTSLIIDWLTSPETSYLAYLTRYLRLMAADFSAFVQAASSSDVSYGSGSSPMDKGWSQVMKKSVEISQSDSGPSSPICGQHRVEASESSLVEEDCDSSPGLSPHTSCLSEKSESADQNTDAACCDHAREPSLGMVLLSCYDDDSSVDDEDESCDEGGFSGVVIDSSRKHQEGNGAYQGKHGTITEDEVKTSQSMGRSTDSDTICSDDSSDEKDDSDTICNSSDEKEENKTSPTANSSISHTETNRSCHSSQSNQLYSLPVTKPQNVHADKRGIVQNCHTDCLDRVMHLLTGVREKLERLDKSGLLVYNPALLLSLIRKCEALYDR